MHKIDWRHQSVEDSDLHSLSTLKSLHTRYSNSEMPEEKSDIEYFYWEQKKDTGI